MGVVLIYDWHVTFKINLTRFFMFFITGKFLMKNMLNLLKYKTKLEVRVQETNGKTAEEFLA